MTKPKLTLEIAQKKPASFIEWLFRGDKRYLSRNRANLEKRLYELNTDLTIEDLVKQGWVRRIAENASQEHYERLIY